MPHRDLAFMMLAFFYKLELQYKIHSNHNQSFRIMQLVKDGHYDKYFASRYLKLSLWVLSISLISQVYFA